MKVGYFYSRISDDSREISALMEVMVDNQVIVYHTITSDSEGFVKNGKLRIRRTYIEVLGNKLSEPYADDTYGSGIDIEFVRDPELQKKIRSKLNCLHYQKNDEYPDALIFL